MLLAAKASMGHAPPAASAKRTGAGAGISLTSRVAPSSPSSVSDLRLLSDLVYKERLQGCARVLGLARLSTSCAEDRPQQQYPSLGLGDLAASADLLLLLLEQLDVDAWKVALASVSKAVLATQRRVRPATSYRARVSLQVLCAARAAGWRVEQCHVDKRSGHWTIAAMGSTVQRGAFDSEYLADVEALSVVGRPDCALLILSPFTSLAALHHLRILEFEQCAIGDAGLAVLSAAFRSGAMQQVCPLPPPPAT